MVAERYMDTPTDKIPGARKGYDKSVREMLERTAKQGIPATIVCPDGVVELNLKKGK